MAVGVSREREFTQAGPALLAGAEAQWETGREGQLLCTLGEIGKAGVGLKRK